jgi:hypothetical protein
MAEPPTKQTIDIFKIWDGENLRETWNSFGD